MKTLIVLLGPTGVGKTALSLEIAERFGSAILSADSRQLYKELPIGTAAPTLAQRQRIPHYFVGMLELTDYYSASQFEQESLALLDNLFQTQEIAVMTGGSMMYIDAVCKGIDDMPTISQEIRDEIYAQYKKEGLQPILDELKKKDPEHYTIVDKMNYKRVIHAVEVCRMTGKTYTSFRTNPQKTRPFKTLKIGLIRDREELGNRINERVDQMMQDGLLDEAKKVFPHKHLNALNTVGYKELFRYLEGEWTLDFAIEKIKRNSRVYARKQMTWFKKDPEITWFSPDNKEKITNHIIRHIV
ncbi:MAG: tRNA (adenosine(37)-N6)-dimethylallyltransferase MiaA [Massilibacteroides sp.]|nr:tRNA (adenosine(37)-N6)-dimethylallyltransferase MiaA [Massilibacteroides sp.]MDD3061557.1 tRNA (adenosine(37)-N6)-dimethylallyltransferase MiaA [Massilibacteroides sp.]MDD4114555.1 tRNA (adenosine(37)-N6)-dimethylallyltransferase MiaA [Massilibacteroides sp.]MDD4659153.1 tRNA (adenosine(37)-N6)-dimethylallyltransferase MiaA [Massilibacteroides sp.]